MTIRNNISTKLSKVVSVREILIHTISKMMNKEDIEVEDVLEKSECGAKINNLNDTYYISDINNIVEDFARECEEKYKWTRI